MPELPEVETVRRDLEVHLLNAIIESVAVLHPKSVKNPTDDFCARLTGQSFVAFERQGKLLQCRLSSGEWLLVHLKMTGQCIVRRAGKVIGGGGHPSDIDNLPNAHTRVILRTTGDTVFFFNAYEIHDTAGTLLSSEAAGSVATVVYDRASKQYTVMTSSVNVSSNTPVRFTAPYNGATAAPLDQSLIFTITSYHNHPSWNTAIDYNDFRNTLEVRYAPKTDKVWVINELSLEQYLKGLGETSNNSAPEFQKALIIAARTYAQYHINNSTKYADQGFTVTDTDADQVYNGYTSEKLAPKLAASVEATRGVQVYYQTKLAITPYFSQSDGRTRNWTEVWGGAGYAWLIGVPDPTNVGLQMLGHGVGMSAVGALKMAGAGSGFEEILKHYYTGIDLRKMYQ